MRFYTQQHQYSCGIDLHARSLYLCILDQSGKILVHRNLRATPSRSAKRRRSPPRQRQLASTCPSRRRRAHLSRSPL
jgi:hypothetical protein